MSATSSSAPATGAREREWSAAGLHPRDALIPAQPLELIEIHVAAAEHADDLRSGRRLDEAVQQRATGAAAAPSGTSFAWCIVQTTASKICSSGSVTISSTYWRTMSKVFSPTRFTRRPSMMQSTRSSVTSAARVDAALHPRRAGRLDADDADLRVDALERHRDAGDQPAAANRHDDDVDVGPVLGDLEPDRALPHDQLLVVERDGCRCSRARRRAASPSRSPRPRSMPCSTTSAP